MPDEWFYVADRKKMGPVPFAQLQALAGSGQLKPADMVLQGGTTKWAAAETVANLFQASSDYLPTAPSEQEQAQAREGFADMIEEAPRHMKPHQGGLVLTLGAVSIGMGSIGLLAACPSCTQFMVPFPVISLGLGVPAFIVGGKHLRLMKSGLMDPQGEGQTRSGWICGIIGTVLGVLGVLIFLVVVVLIGAMYRSQD
jgi:hypothetical protein